MKIGDKVIITQGPINKIGKVGIISMLALNGAMIKFPNGMATVVKFNHFKKYDKITKGGK